MAGYAEIIQELQESGRLDFNNRTSLMDYVPSVDWTAQLERFKKIARDFVARFDEMKNLAPYALGSLKSDYDQLMDLGGTIRARLAEVSRGFDWGLNTFLDGQPAGMAGLGLGPLVLVPIALVAGLIAAITAWMSESTKLRQKLQFIKQQQEQGATADEIQNFLDAGVAEVSDGWLASIGNLAALGLVGYFLLKVFRK